VSAATQQPSYLLGLVGEGIRASLTPAMHEREGAQCGLRINYRLIDTGRLGIGSADLPALLDWAERLGFDGLNITHPFKQVVVPLLHELSADAADLGAVNTVVFHEGRRLGRNTDWSGYGRAFRAALPDAVQDRVLLVGAGGAGAAVGYGLLDQGAAHVAVLDADPGRAEACADRLAKRYGDARVEAVTDVAEAVEGAQGLVNATPLGMVGHPGMAVPDSSVRSDLWVSDVVYFPLETELVRLARSRGCRVVSGGGMAVHQAVGAFEYFTGRVPDTERMTRHFEELAAA
jgi:shikimate dehydrogenase